MRSTPTAMSSGTSWEEIRSGLIVATAVVVLVELILLRVLTRTFVHIPGLALDAGPLSLLAAVGRLAYFASVVSVIGLLAVLWITQVRAGATMAAVAISLFVVAAAGARIGLLDPAWVPAAVVLSVVILAGSAIRRMNQMRLAVVGLAGAVVIYGAWALGAQLSTAGFEVPETFTAVLPIGEALVLFGLAVLPLTLRAPRSMRRFDRITILVALAVGLAVFIGLQMAGAMFKILLLWNLGLAGYLPALAYAVAAAGAAAAVVLAIRTGRIDLAAAIILLLAGGFALTNTYQSGLKVVAFGILAMVPSDAGRADAGRADAGRST